MSCHKQAGVPLDKLDAAIKEYGFPVGPITLADEVRARACVCVLGHTGG